MRVFSLLCLLFLTVPTRAAEPTPAPMPAERAARLMTLPDGFRASVFAAEPDVVQPISFCFDDRGRLFVAEALNYGEWKPTGKDRIVILEDTTGDGRADRRTVFYEGFNYITGIEYGFGGVWVMSPPGLYFVPDRNRDDKPDGPPELMFDGFGHKESRHNLANGFTWGPDGWLYAGHGRTSPSDVGRPGTPAKDRIHCDGGVYRIHPDRLVFENFADGTTNPWGVDFDDYGQCFVSNCVNPHLFHMIQGGHYEPWRNRPSSRYAYERISTIADHLHYAGLDLRARLGTDETLALGGGHAHCGTLVYLGDRFPAEFRNTVMMCNVHGKRVNRDILKRQGSGYSASHGPDLMISPDPWFMGVTLRTGPDGCVYVSDWSDTGECHTYKPHTENGRIYRISYGEDRPVKVNLSARTDQELVEMQKHPNDWHVRHARRLLQERSNQPDWVPGPSNLALRKQLDDRAAPVPQRLRALWALHATGGLTLPDKRALLEDPSDHLRAWAIQLLCESKAPGAASTELFARLAAEDPSPVVRLALACSLQRVSPREGWPIAEKLAARGEDADDPNLPLMLWYGIESLFARSPDDRLQRIPDHAAPCRIPLVRRLMARRLFDVYLEENFVAPIDAWVDSIKKSPPEHHLAWLFGARDALRGIKNRISPHSWDELFPVLLASRIPEVRSQASLIALAFGDAKALINLRALVREESNPLPTRREALEALIDHRDKELPEFLHSLLDDESLRRTAIRGLSALPHRKTATLLLQRYSTLSTEEKGDAVATLAARKGDAAALVEAIESGAIPVRDVSAYAARQIHSLGDTQLSSRLQKAWGEIRETPAEKKKQLANYQAALTPAVLRAADLSQGRALYQKHCQSCHKLYGEGGTIGPDLTGSNRNDLTYLLSNLVDPSAEVSKDYRMSVLTTRDERVLTGILVEKTAARVVLQTATERLTIAAEDVESIRESATSIMPDGQLDALKKDEIRDLVGYLQNRSQVPLPKKRP